MNKKTRFILSLTLVVTFIFSSVASSVAYSWTNYYYMVIRVRAGSAARKVLVHQYHPLQGKRYRWTNNYGTAVFKNTRKGWNRYNWRDNRGVWHGYKWDYAYSYWSASDAFNLYW